MFGRRIRLFKLLGFEVRLARAIASISGYHVPEAFPTYDPPPRGKPLAIPSVWIIDLCRREIAFLYLRQKSLVFASILVLRSSNRPSNPCRSAISSISG